MRDLSRYFADRHPVTGWRVIDRRDGEVVATFLCGGMDAEDQAKGYASDLNGFDRDSRTAERGSD